MTAARLRPTGAEANERLLPSFGLALVMHALLLAAMTLAVQWRTQPSAPVVAEIWSSLPAAQPMPPVPEPEPEPEPTPAPPPPPPPPAPEPEPEIVVEKKPPPKKVEPPKEEQPPPPEPKKPEPKKPEPKKPEPKKEAPKKAEPPKQAEPPRPRTDMERLMAQAGATAASPGAATAPGSAAAPGTTASGVRGGDSSYSALVIGCIRPHIVYVVPPGTGTHVYADFRVELLPDGSVAGLRLVRASGLAGYDAAAERAIRRCDPFPRKRDGTLDRTIDIRMYPVEPR